MKKKSNPEKKIRRYSNLMREVTNWPRFLLYKMFGSRDSFTFRMKNDFEITVDKMMFSPFKEIFFDQVYLNGITRQYLTNQQPVVVDVGANVGFFSLFVLSKFPQAYVYAFEPMPFNFKVLEKYRSHFSGFNLTTVNKAVSASDQPLKLNASSIDGFTTMSGIIKNEKRTQTIEVQSTTLAAIFSDFSLDSIDFLKLDCEGSEYSILYSAPVDLFDKIKIMTIEVHPGSKENENLHSLAEYLNQNGFKLNTYQEGEGGYIWAWRN